MRLLRTLITIAAAMAALIVATALLGAEREANAATAGETSVEKRALRSHYVEGVGGVPINVIEAGERGKPALVFVHGLGQSHLSWQWQLQSALADEFHLVAFDLRGHGNSGKPWRAGDYIPPDIWAGDLGRVIAATRAHDPILVTWSYGTWVGVDYLRYRHPTPVKAIVMIGGLGGLIQPPPSVDRGTRSEEGERLARLADSGWLADGFERGEGINRLFIRKPVDAVWARRTASVNAMLPPYARPLILSRSFDNSDALATIQIPVWLVVGSEDINVPLDQARMLDRKLPASKLSVYEDVGHMPFAEERERFNRELAKFAHQSWNES